MTAPGRYVHTLYADDLRREINGKLSYIGVYANQLVCQQFPLALPHFVISTFISTPIAHPWDFLAAKVFQIDADGTEKELAKVDFDVDAMRAQMTELGETADSDVRTIMANTIFVLAIQIEGPCKLRMVATVDDEELRGPGLEIIQGSLAEQ